MTESRTVSLLGVLVVVVAGLGARPAAACHDGSPILLDLDGDRVQTSGLESDVWFDIDANGVIEHVAWTTSSAEDAFLWLDRNGNQVVDDGGELFGDATILLSGDLAESGFDALAEFDHLAMGGNGDGAIDHEDRVWNDLRLWIDRNQNATSERSEVSGLPERGVIRISLESSPSDLVDGNGNLHRYIGSFEMRDKQFEYVREAVDVFFRIAHE